MTSAEVEMLRKSMVGYVSHFVGTFYTWGGDDPSSFDCSGLVVEALKSVGLISRHDDRTADDEVRGHCKDEQHPRQTIVVIREGEENSRHRPQASADPLDFARIACEHRKSYPATDAGRHQRYLDDAARREGGIAPSPDKVQRPEYRQEVPGVDQRDQYLQRSADRASHAGRLHGQEERQNCQRERISHQKIDDCRKQYQREQHAASLP